MKSTSLAHELRKLTFSVFLPCMVRCIKCGETIQIEVEDTGAGMTPERMAEVKKSLETDASVGFGLVAVFRRLQLYFHEQCSMSVKSQLEEGTTFYIEIPAQPLQGGHDEAS